MARDLTDNEVAILEFLLSYPGIPCREAYLAQIPSLRVVRRGRQMPTWLDLATARGATRADCPNRRPLSAAMVVSMTDEPIGELILWAEKGLLNEVEYPWFTDEMPSAFPDVGQLHRIRPVAMGSGWQLVIDDQSVDSEPPAQAST